MSALVLPIEILATHWAASGAPIGRCLARRPPAVAACCVGASFFPSRLSISVCPVGSWRCVSLACVSCRVEILSWPGQKTLRHAVVRPTCKLIFAATNCDTTANQEVRSRNTGLGECDDQDTARERTPTRCAPRPFVGPQSPVPPVCGRYRGHPAVGKHPTLHLLTPRDPLAPK